MSAAHDDHPAPHLRRDLEWFRIDGTWEFLPDPAASLSIGDLPPSDRWGRIEVPFAWETPASGVGRHWLARGWYRRRITVPADWAPDHAILHFGAASRRATVWADGVPLGAHDDGYLPFEFDLAGRETDAIEITVRVDAPVDKRFHPHGKQRSLPRDDYWEVEFDATSGLWQSVWIERRPERHLTAVRIDSAGLEGFEVMATADPAYTGDVRCTVRSNGVVVASGLGRSGAPLQLPIEHPVVWSPESPHLYELELVLVDDVRQDAVRVAAGIRRFEVRDGAFHLNGRRISLRGVLDQGYWPATGMTAPTREALGHDLRLAKRAGYNLVRKHIKVEDPRWLAEADRIGMLVWAEPPSFSRFSLEAATRFAELAAGMIERDRSHPSIVIWGLYNEEWGADWGLDRPEIADEIRRLHREVKRIDPTRPVIDNSGWAHVESDIVDWHHYSDAPDEWRRDVRDLTAGTRRDVPTPVGSTTSKALYARAWRGAGVALPIMNSEYGTGRTGIDRGWQLRWQTQELRRHDRNGGYVYCELVDVEHEPAGLFDADRRPKDLGNTDPAIVNAETTVVFSCLPIEPGVDVDYDGPFELGLRLSHHGSAPIAGAVVAGWVPHGGSIEDADLPIPVADIEVAPFRLSDEVVLRTDLPPGWPAGRLVVGLVTASAGVVARGFLDVATQESRPWEMRGRSRGEGAG